MTGASIDPRRAKILDARAPDSGVVLFIRAVPSMTKGETIANIGIPSSR